MIFPFLFTQCIKDEMPEIDTPVSSDIELYINEVLTTGDPDWVELYNASDEEIDLSGFDVSDGPTAKYTIPDGVTIAASGYYQFMCDKSITGFSLSSGGEEFYIWDKEGNIVDQVSFGALDSGISYGRTTDAGATWANMGPTPAAANSTVNNAPILTATAIENINDNEAYELEVIASDADGIRDVKFFMETESGLTFVEMAPLGGGDYKYIIEPIAGETTVEYYIVATDETGKKSYFPETAPDTKATFTVEDGFPIFSNLNINPEEVGANQAATFTVDVFDASGIDEVKIYYTVNSDVADDKKKEVMTYAEGNTYTFDIPGQAGDAVVRYYMRAEDNNGNKTYYLLEEYDADDNVTSDFDHDDATTWPSYTVGAAPIVIINGFSELEVTGGTSTEDLNLSVNIAYSNGDVEEVKFYYIINYNAATYDKDVDRKDIEWSGDLPTTDNLYNFTIPASELNAGDKVIWYMRAKDGEGDKMYFTEGQDETFDKDVIADWNEITIN